MIAALYVDPRGPYARMPDVDPWDETRDARCYEGPHPIVAHPPCGPWGGLRHLSRGHGRDCGPRAVEQVRAHGGVLEHPARSKLWAHCELPRPGELSFGDPGFTIEIEQVSWGHVARKMTWLYCVGVDVNLLLATVRGGGNPTHWISGGRKPRLGGGAVPAGIKVCSEQQRRRTPPLFAQWLVLLATSAAAPSFTAPSSPDVVARARAASSDRG